MAAVCGCPELRPASLPPLPLDLGWDSHPFARGRPEAARPPRVCPVSLPHSYGWGTGNYFARETVAVPIFVTCSNLPRQRDSRTTGT